MKTKNNSRRVSTFVLIILLILLGIGGIGGGIAMLIDPSGGSMGLPNSLLDNLPISDFILPGLFLIIVMGSAPCVIAYAVWKRKNWAQPATLLQGIVLVLWICLQILLWGNPLTIQVVFLFWGIALLVVGWLVGE